MSDCSNCLILQSEVDRLEIENQKLQREIFRLRKIIDRAESESAMVATEANVILSTSQPKGVWAYNKGKKESADRIGQTLYY